MAMFFRIPVYGLETRASTQISNTSVMLSQKSNGDFNVYFSVRATGIMDVIGASSVKVQRHTIFGWITEHTFTPDNTPELQAENKAQHSAALTYSPLFTGKEYRAVVTIYVKDVSGASTQHLTSKTVTT